MGLQKNTHERWAQDVPAHVQGAILVIVCLLLGFHTRSFEFVWDDAELITRNTAVTGPFSIGRILTTTFIFPDVQATPFYRPLQLLLHAGEHRIFGEWAGGFHLVGVLLHTAVTLLVFLLARRLFTVAGGAFWGALLFAAHPLHAEPVGFISAHGDLIAAMFSLLACAACLAATRSRESKRARLHAALAGVTMFLALLSKESAFFVPAALFFLIWVADDPPFPAANRSARTAVSLAVATAFFGYLFLRLTLLPERSALPQFETDPGGAFRRLGSYAGLFVDLPAIRVLWPARPGGWSASSWYGLALLLGGSALVLLPRGRRRLRLFLWLWFLLTLVLSLKFVAIPAPDLAARYAYLPSVAVAWAVAWGSDALLLRAGRTGRWVIVACLCALVAVSCVFWYSELSHWKSRLILYARMVEENPEHGRSHFNLAQALATAGRSSEAIEAYRRAARLEPGHASTQHNLGMYLLDAGLTNEGLTHLQQYLRLRPEAPERNFILSLQKAR